LDDPGAGRPERQQICSAPRGLGAAADDFSRMENGIPGPRQLRLRPGIFFALLSIE